MNTDSPPGVSLGFDAFSRAAKNSVRAALMMSASHPLLVVSSSIIRCAKWGFPDKLHYLKDAKSKTGALRVLLLVVPMSFAIKFVHSGECTPRRRRLPILRES